MMFVDFSIKMLLIRSIGKEGQCCRCSSQLKAHIVRSITTSSSSKIPSDHSRLKDIIHEEQIQNNQKSSPVQNLRDAMKALDAMIEEADKKIEKKYRPNMFAEFKQLNESDGKISIASNELIPVNKSKKVIPLKVKSLVGQEVDIVSVLNGKTTLLLTSFKNFGLEKLPSWRNHFMKHFGQDKRVQCVTLSIIEEWYMMLVQGSIRKGLMAKIPEDLYAKSYTHYGRCNDFRTVFDMNNSFFGYMHLVDPKGRIRWR
jgi:hypothetical protein